MSAPFLVILSLGAALACWVVLSLMGTERVRRLSQIPTHRPNPAPPAPTPAILASEQPVGIAGPPQTAKPRAAKPQPPVARQNVR